MGYINWKMIINTVIASIIVYLLFLLVESPRIDFKSGKINRDLFGWLRRKNDESDVTDEE